MKKSIIVFLLVIILLLPTACKKEKKTGSENVYPKIEDININNEEEDESENTFPKNEVTNENKESIPINQNKVTPQCKNGYLFKAFYSDKLQIKQFNFDTLKEELVGELNACIEDYWVISPDRKKIAYLGRSPRRELPGLGNYESPYDLYVMNVDGSDIKRITFNIKFFLYGPADSFKTIFTPDSQEIIISSDYWSDSPEVATYLINFAQNTCTKYDENNPLYWPMQSYIEQQGMDFSDNDFIRRYFPPVLPNGDNYLVWHQSDSYPGQRTELGTFNWKKKEYKKICSSPIPDADILSAVWSFDFSKIIIKVDESDKHYIGSIPYHILIYDISTKSFFKVLDMAYNPEEICSEFYTMVNRKYLLFFQSKKLWSFDIENHKKAEIITFKKTCSICPLDENRCIIKGDEKEVYLFSSSDHSLVKLSIPVNSSNFVMLDHFLYFTTDKTFAKYDFPSKTFQALYESDFQNKFSVFFLPKNQLFYFYSSLDDILVIQDKTGRQITKIKNIDSIPFPDYLDSTIRFHSDHFYYFTRQSQSSDLYYAKSIQDKPINLTQGKYPVLRSELSPDQDKVAFYSLDSIANTASVHLINMKNPKKVMTLATFTFDYPVYPSWGCFPREYPEEHFLTLSWSKDSQWIYFVTRDASKRFMIYRAKADGKEMTLLSDPKSSSFGSMVSPDGKQIVYVTGEERKIALMNTDGTNKKIISDGIATKQCFFPAWSPDGKMIAFNQLIMEDRRFDTPNLTNQIIIITPQGKVIEKIDCKYINPRSTYPEFYQSRNFWSYSTNYFSCLQSVNNTYAGEVGYHSDSQICVWEKNFFNGEPIEPIIRTFKWAHSKDNLMLFVTQHSNFLDNKIQLFDCKTKQYTTITQYISILSDAAWSPEDSEVLYAGTDMLSGQMVFKVASSDGSYQKLLFTFGENPLEQPSSIADIDELVWLKK
jgi:Tol biopolymer transport system component